MPLFWHNCKDITNDSVKKLNHGFNTKEDIIVFLIL